MSAGTCALLLTLSIAASAIAQEKAAAPQAPKRPAAAAKAMDEGAKRDLAMLQGTWEHEVRDRQGKVLGRIVKHIQGTKEMVIHERPDGKVAHAHRVDIEVLRAHDVRVFRFTNGEILEGPNKGQKMEGSAYVYRITEDTFTEVFGFIVGQEQQQITARVYKRVKEKQEPKDEE